MPDLRDIHKVGWTLVPMLWLSSADKAEEPEVQGKAKGEDKEAGTQSSKAYNCSRKINQWIMSLTQTQERSSALAIGEIFF
jgi:hypothetical protein